MYVRYAKIGDENEIARVHIDTRKSTYSDFISNESLSVNSYEDVAKKWLKRIANTNSTEIILVIEDNSRIIGFASASTSMAEEGFDALLSTIYILKEYQRKGIGKLLLKTMVKLLIDKNVNSIMVWVFNDNPCKEFYIKLGGNPFKQKTVYYDKEILETAYGYSNLNNLYQKL